LTGSAPPAVVTALREEVAPLLSRARVERRLRLRPGCFFRIRLGGRPLVAGWTGDGNLCAAAGLRALLAEVRVEALWLMGIAGGLSPELGVGDLVVAGEVHDAEGTAPPPDPAWLERVLAVSGGAAGILVSAGRIATTPEEKAALWTSCGEPVPAAVDLETAAWARVAGELGVPYLAVRAVSDTASETLPVDFNRLRGADGRVRRSRVVLEAVRRPRLIPGLFDLGRRTRRCAERLADLAEAIL